MFSGSSNGFVFGLILSTVCGLILAYMASKQSEINTMKETKDMEIIDYRDGYIALNKRTNNNGNVLKVVADREYSMKDHPAELVYTSATVGGITTGGFHVNEAYRTESIGGKTGTYYISLRGTDHDTRVKKIRIQSDMIESAKADPVVKEFLDGTTLTLKHNVPVSIPTEIKKTAEGFLKMGRYDVAAKLYRPYTKACELTQEECKAVVAWMSGKSG